MQRADGSIVHVIPKENHQNGDLKNRLPSDSTMARYSALARQG
jgi:hypothetical protein